MTPSPRPYGIHWFRRDLRIAGNPALGAAREAFDGRVLGVFSFDDAFLAREDFSHDRFGFFLATLKALREDLRVCGGDLLVLRRGPERDFTDLLGSLEKAGLPLPAAVHFNRDYEPFARRRDGIITALLKERGVEVRTSQDHLILEPTEVLKPDGGFYQVFTPFGRRWFAALRSAAVKERIEAQRQGLRVLRDWAKGKPPHGLFQLTWAELFGGGAKAPADHLEDFIARNARDLSVPLPPAGQRAAHGRLMGFAGENIDHYETRRDFPAEDGTSGLSVYFKNGSLTAAQAVAALGLEGLPFDVESGPGRFLKELAWREFYYSILWHQPRVEGEAFIKKHKTLKWRGSDAHFKAWCDGRTGYPIVDAGMRQLAKTGWMHNRVRMITASFLVKDLLIDWRRGENWFMRKLLDGDLAPNNGGWQWAASTGCDPQPYFRVFNPRLQGERFDPEGAYVARWVPELKGLRGRAIHDPTPLDRAARGYPEPIVDHGAQKAKAIALFKA